MKLFLTLLISCISFINNDFPRLSQIDYVVKYIADTKDGSKYALFIDMSIPSDEKRLFLVHLASRKIIYSTYVAHGKGSGKGKKADKFSDLSGSHCTALGFYKVGKNYQGKHGSTFELIGLEKSNVNALQRGIVIHSVRYVTEEFIKKYGRCGTSWGCPAVSEEALNKLKPFLTQNIIVYIYR